MKWNISLASVVAVLGTDPEMADMSNPRGEIYGEQVFLQATNERGQRYEGPLLGLRRDVCDEHAQGYVLEYQGKFDRGEIDPENHPDWSPGRPVYGSEEYEQSGQELIDAFVERHG